MSATSTATTAFNALRQRLEPALAELNNHISAALSAPNVLADNIIREYLRSSGKQLRPMIVILAAELFSGNKGIITADVIHAAAAVELLHNASLIHDDVVDDSDLRRGRPTINNLWDSHIAVLIGDYFTSTSLQEAVAGGDVRIVRVIAALGRMLSMGEMDQIYNAREHLLTEADYFKVIGRKTASLFTACAEMGVFAVGIDAADPRLGALRDFIYSLGLCFQIKDDIFDYYDAEAIGKPTGNDLREGKITLPLIHALLQTELPDQPRMLELSRKDRLTDREIAELICFAKENGGIDYAYTTMEEMRHRATRRLTSVFSAEQAADLITLFDYIIARKN